jgi:hypothetical protein
VLHWIRESRHAGEADTILDNPEEIAVREVLCFLEAKIGRVWIKTLAEQGLAAAVIVVARCAMIREVQSRYAQVLFGSDNRVWGGSGVSGDGETADITRDRRFQLARSGSRTQAVMEKGCDNSNYDAHHRNTNH